MTGPGRFVLSRAVRATALAAAMLVAAPAAAQQMGIAAVVNDQLITAFDLSQRLVIAIGTAGLPNTEDVRERLTPQVLRGLVTEALQLQEAERLGLGVSRSEVDGALRVLEERNNIPPGGLPRYLEQRGLAMSAIEAQVRAELAWNKILRQRVIPAILVSEEQIDEAVARAEASQGRHRLLLDEIFLVVDSEDGEPLVRAEIERIVSDLRAGADFRAVARQFSQGAAAYDGGDIGWVLEDQLAPEIAAAVAELEIGGLTGPISSAGGYYVVRLRDRVLIGGVDLLDTVLHLKQIALPLTAAAQEIDVARALARGQSISSSLRGCTSMDEMIEEVGNLQSGDLGAVRIGDMPPRFRDAVMDLPVGQPSAPVRSETGVHVFMACERIEAEPDEPDRDEFANSIWSQQLDMRARRYIRDLHRSATIDIR
jgi:peptidyl-prolyl cis-trans isomerase SurA